MERNGAFAAVSGMGVNFYFVNEHLVAFLILIQFTTGLRL
jgi:hypothetical protein